MRIYKLPLAVITCILLSFSTSIAADTDTSTVHPFVVTGVVKNSNSSLILENFSQYLSQHSGYPLKVVYAENYSDLSRKMRNNPHAIGWTCGVPYAQDQKSDNQQLVAVPTFKQNATYYSLVLTRSNRSEKSLIDFKNGILAYSDPRSNSGFLAPKYALFKQGIDMQEHFRLLLNAGNHEGSIDALLNGLADVAAVDEYIWISYIKDFPEAKNKLHEIERMGPYPFTPIVASKGVTSQQLKSLTSALKNMNNNSRGKKLLKQFNLNGFVEKKPEFYNPIRAMLKEVDIITGI